MPTPSAQGTWHGFYLLLLIITIITRAFVWSVSFVLLVFQDRVSVALAVLELHL